MNHKPTVVMPSYQLTRKYRATFFIFPAFLPLVELLPWFLALLGAAAGGTQIVGKVLWRRRWQRALLVLINLGLFGWAGWLVWQRYAPMPAAAVGSELAPSLPRHEVFATHTSRPLPLKTITPLSELWKTGTPNNNLGKPLVYQGRLYVGTIEGSFDAYDAADGHTLWSLHKRESVYTPPSAAADRLFIGEGYHTSPVCELTALALPEGKPLWSRRFRSHLESYPALDLTHNRLWQGGGSTGLWALAADSGKLLWWQPIGHIDVPPLYRDGRLFAIAKLREDADGTALFEFDPATGTIKWQVPLQGNTMGSLFPHGDRIYVSTALGQVGDLKANDAGWVQAVSVDGKPLWRTALPAMPLPEGALAADGGTLFYTLKDGSVVALRTADGAIIWREKIGDEIQTDVALIEEAGTAPMVVAVAHDGTVSLRDAASGTERHKLQVEPGDSNPVYAQGVLYVATPRVIHAYAGFGAR